VCDPFLGSGSSAIASIGEGRNFIGIELYPVWLSLAKQRIAQTSNPYCVDSDLRCGDSLEVMRTLDNESIDFIVTSPPYWGILDKIDHKANGERISKGLATDYGNNESDLASVKSYSDFMGIMTRHLKEYYRVLRSKQYAAIIVSDFRHGKEYFLFHADIASAMKQAGFMIQGLITLVQDNKKLYPYGYPSAYVPNISNQFIIIGRKL
jgi:DNA modification methylase